MRYVLPVLFALTSSAFAGLLDQVPTDTMTLRGDYRALATCAYKSLDQTGIKIAELPGEVRVMLESGAVRYWQLVFRPAGTAQTRVELSEVQTMWGPQRATGVREAVRSCGT